MTIEIEEAYSLAKGDELDFISETAFELTGEDTQPSLTVAGTVTVVNKSPGLGISVIKGGPQVALASVWVQKRGVIVATGVQTNDVAIGEFGCPADVINDGHLSVTTGYVATGFRFWKGGVFSNSGHLTVQAKGDATAVVGATDFLNSGEILVTAKEFAGGISAASVDNSGQIKITGDSETWGVLATASFHNSGHILVHGQSRDTAGVTIYSSTDVVNHGSIVVKGGDAAFGVSCNLGGDQFAIVNTGLISAETALSLTSSQINVENSGRILGDVWLSNGGQVHNTGLIRGDVWLGGGAGLYDADGKGVLVGTVHGGFGDDVLIGGKSADHLEGGDDSFAPDADTLIGAGGGDTLTGSKGNDHFVYLSISDSKAAHSDLITDIETGDTIDLSAIDADTTQNGNQTFVLTATLDRHAGEAALDYDVESGLTRLRLDVNGDGKADAVILMSGQHLDFVGFEL